MNKNTKLKKMCSFLLLHIKIELLYNRTAFKICILKPFAKKDNLKSTCPKQRSKQRASVPSCSPTGRGVARRQCYKTTLTSPFILTDEKIGQV